MNPVWAIEAYSGGGRASVLPARIIGLVFRVARLSMLGFLTLFLPPILSLAMAVTVCSTSAQASDVIEVWRGGGFTTPASVSVNETDGSCWVADGQGSLIVHLAADGTELWRGNSFNTPWGVSANASGGSCCVSDRNNNQIVRLAADGTEAFRAGGFNSPRGLSVDPNDGSCWVADFSNDQVVHLAVSGSETWRGGTFYQPVDTSVNASDGTCWVADFRNNQVVHLDTDGSELGRFGGFSLPISVSVNPTDGSCWVADFGNSQVVHLAEDGTELWRGSAFSSPRGICVDAVDDSCWVADSGNNEVVHLSSGHSELWRGTGFSLPMAVSVDQSNGTCWVADNGNGDVVRLDFLYDLSVGGDNGQLLVDGSHEFLPYSTMLPRGREVTLEAVPDSTYEFTGWSGDLSGSENPTTVTVTSDMSITANFSKIQYQLDLTGIGDGTVLVDGVEHSLPWSGLFDAETSVDLEAVPGSCYDFDSWSGDMTGASNPKTITMTAPKSVTANFTQLTHTLAISGTGLGSVSVDGVLQSLPWSGDFLCGETVNLEVVPAACWQFAGWSGDLTGSESPTEIVVDSDKTVTANFSQIEYSLSIDAAGSGSIIVDGIPHSLPWTDTFACGSTVSVQAVPNSCYEFDSWSGALTGSVNPRVVSMDGAKSITAHFTKIQYTLDLTSDGSGSVTVDGVEHSLPWSGTFDCGDVVTLDAVPEACYEFSGWTGDITWASAPVDVVMDAAKSITANFSQAEYTLTLTGEGGSVLVDHIAQTLPWSDSFLCGETVALEAVPDEHRAFTGWSGDLAGSSNPTSLVIDGDKSVTVTFGYVSYTLNVSATGDGSIAVDGTPVELPFSQPYVYGTTVELTASPDEGVRFVGWTGAVESAETQVSVEIAGPMSVTAVFEPLVDFTDIEAGHWAISAIAACVDAGIVTGFPDGFYRPNMKVDRAAMAVFIARGMAGGDADVPTGPAEATFPDVSSDHWAYKYIEYVAGNNVVEGYPDGSYQPDWDVTRGQMAVFVARTIADPPGDEGLASYVPPAIATFSDVPVDYWCFTHIEYLVSNEIVGGYPDGLYRPTTDVTRDQMAVYIARAFGLL